MREGIEVRTVSPDETRALGAALVRAALPLPRDGLVVSLHGDLGSGKTVFVQGVAAALGIPASVPVVSPTFTIARSYPAPAEGVDTLHHVDAYRLRGPEELEHAGFEDMRGRGCLTCVEWGERVADALPEDRVEVWIEPDPSGASLAAADTPLPPSSRRLRFAAGGLAARRVLDALRARLAPRSRT